MSYLDTFNKVEDVCIYDAPPACVTKCPVHVDARGIAKALSAGDFKGAYKLFSASAPFPHIISETCTRFCESACARLQSGGAVQIGELERACVEYGYKKSVLNKAFLPMRSEKIAVIGGGLCGISAAYYLRRKGFQVDIYEKSDRLGGKLSGLLPGETIEKDISIIFDLGVNVLYNAEVRNISELENKYNALFIAAGSGTFDFSADSDTLYVRDNLFSVESGLTRGYSSVLSLSDGRRAATSIERHLQNVSKTFGREKEGSYDTIAYAELSRIKPIVPVPVKNGLFVREDAILESARCLDCRCNKCVSGCAFLTHYDTNPKKFIREVRNCLAISVGDRYANEAINSCSECGFCGAVCPVGLDTGKVCGEAKKKMVETKKMPPSAHDFALLDMAHSNGDDCFLARGQKGIDKCEYLFFPGCQLGATAPDIVRKVYADLCDRLHGGVGIMLGCCGAIANWAAREELFHNVLGKIKQTWTELGTPSVITACPACYRIFKENIPEMNVIGIWSILEAIGLPALIRKPVKLVVHDACTIREEDGIHASVRRLLSSMNVEIEELGYSRGLTQCCGYGGLTGFVNRELSDKAAKLRITQSRLDYAVYCINCRDRFMANGKKAYHLLELAYGEYNGEIKKFGWSERRENKASLKRGLLKEIWGEQMKAEEELKLRIEEQAEELIQQRMILLSDIRSVISNAESTGKKLKDNETGRFIASGKLGDVTFWVWYTQNEDGYTVYKAYSHRMIVGEM